MFKTTTHLFLTGEMGIGKSTLVRKLMSRAAGAAGGFLTVKTEGLFPGKPSLHLLTPDRPLIPTAENFLTFCGEATGETAVNFDRLGCAALSHTENLKLLVMDELGPHETEAALFRKAVLKALDGSVPILGVLQKADSPFLSEIRTHPKVTVIEVTRQNRDCLEREVLCFHRGLREIVIKE